jgi:hypothetical protein
MSFSLNSFRAVIDDACERCHLPFRDTERNFSCLAGHLPIWATFQSGIATWRAAIFCPNCRPRCPRRLPRLAITIGSEDAGPRVAAIVSIVETCWRLKIPVRDYLGSVLPGLTDFPVNRISELTPTAWVTREARHATLNRWFEIGIGARTGLI